MSKRILHLASFNHILKHKYTDFTYPDPLALINLADLVELNENEVIKFLQQVLTQYKNYNPVDDISIRTAASKEEERRNRPYKLYLKPEASKENALFAYEKSQEFLNENPGMKPADAWLMFAMCNSEMFSGNVSSDIYWPDKVIMEVTKGPYAPLGEGDIVHPESYLLDTKSGQIEYREGSNSPVVADFVGKGLSMAHIETLMRLAAKRPCTLEFIYGQIKRIGHPSPLIFDVKVLRNTKWKFYDTNIAWETTNGDDFLRKLNLIASVAVNEKLPPNQKAFSLIISRTGSKIQLDQKTISLQKLFEVDVFSTQRKEISIQPLQLFRTIK